MSNGNTLRTDDILAVATAVNDAYLAAYRLGYEAGMKRAMDHCLKVINRPITEVARAQVAEEAEPLVEIEAQRINSFFLDRLP
jgi:hypothetical protein